MNDYLRGLLREHLRAASAQLKLRPNDVKRADDKKKKTVITPELVQIFFQPLLNR